MFHFYNLSLKEKKHTLKGKKKKPNNNSKTPTSPPHHIPKSIVVGVWGGVGVCFSFFSFFSFPNVVVGGKNKTVKSSCLSCRWPYTSKIKKRGLCWFILVVLPTGYEKALGLGVPGCVFVVGGKEKQGGGRLVVVVFWSFCALLVVGCYPPQPKAHTTKTNPPGSPYPPFFLPTTNTTAARNRHNNCLHPFDRVSIQAFFTPLSPIRLPLFFFFQTIVFSDSI